LPSGPPQSHSTRQPRGHSRGRDCSSTQQHQPVLHLGRLAPFGGCRLQVRCTSSFRFGRRQFTCRSRRRHFARRPRLARLKRWSDGGNNWRSEIGSPAPARKIEFVEAIQADSPSPVLPAKIFRFARRANHLYKPPPSRLDKRGGSRSSRNAGRDAVDADGAARRAAQDADGEVVWS
jgi:hypothetical protein